MTEHDHLDDIRIASPCPADWSAMSGDERRRFCSQCKLHVYDLSAMTRREAEALVATRDGRLCVRFFRRADGKVLTQDCPVGLRAKLRAVRVRAVAMAGALFTMLLGCVPRGTPAPTRPGPAPIQPLQGEVCEPLMGRVLAPVDPNQPIELMGRVRQEPIDKK